MGNAHLCENTGCFASELWQKRKGIFFVLMGEVKRPSTEHGFPVRSQRVAFRNAKVELFVHILGKRRYGRKV